MPSSRLMIAMKVDGPMERLENSAVTEATCCMPKATFTSI